MQRSDINYSTVTAILPGSTVQRVLSSVEQQQGASSLAWKARGTLLQDHWFKRFLPPISPAKSMLQMLVPNEDIERIVRTVAEEGNLHRQATGAVYSTPCQRVWFGDDFHVWPSNVAQMPNQSLAGLSHSLSLVCCVVGHRQSDKVAKAAINAGAHGPIVYYSEGRGIRDRLGWLRITKEHEKEVLLVLAEDADVEDVFDAMAKAGELHLPGRGFMYRLPVTHGLFNLPGRVSHHHYAANMQQMINAIDHLAGHTHWRDQSVFEVGGNAKGVGLQIASPATLQAVSLSCIAAIARRDDLPHLMDILLDAGAPGLNLHYARFNAANEGDQLAGARINQDYGMLRCVVPESQASSLCDAVTNRAQPAGLADICLMQMEVARVATYVPGRIDFRQSSAA